MRLADAGPAFRVVPDVSRMTPEQSKSWHDAHTLAVKDKLLYIRGGAAFELVLAATFVRSLGWFTTTCSLF